MPETPASTEPPASLDPDRFFNLQTPGSQEWWYFDAISDDGLDALVVTFFVGLPFDPQYGQAVKRHLRRPKKHPAPHPLDHCAVNIAWYRPQGPTLFRKGWGHPGQRNQAYALNSHRRDAFQFEPDPLRIQIAESRMERNDDGYRLVVEAPDWEPNRRISADLRFRPAAGTEPMEREIGGEGSMHRWILAASDCRVEGSLSIDGPNGLSVDFRGRGYHDHNAGAEELSLAMKRWEWGRVHDGDQTNIYYIVEPSRGPRRSLWLTCRDGKPEQLREEPATSVAQPWKTGFFVPYHGALTMTDSDGQQLRRWCDHHVESSPFYQRWMAEYRVPSSRSNRLGFCEQFDGQRLHHPVSNWLVPYRLKRSSTPAGAHQA